MKLVLRLSVALLLAVSCFSLSGCGEGDTSAPTETSSTSSDSTEADGSSAKPESDGSGTKDEADGSGSK